MRNSQAISALVLVVFCCIATGCWHGIDNDPPRQDATAQSITWKQDGSGFVAITMHYGGNTANAALSIYDSNGLLLKSFPTVYGYERHLGGFTYGQAGFLQNIGDIPTFVSLQDGSRHSFGSGRYVVAVNPVNGLTLTSDVPIQNYLYYNGTYGPFSTISILDTQLPDSGRVLRSLRLGYIGGSSIIWTDSARFMIPILDSTNALCLTRLDTSLQVVSKTIYPASFGEPSSISYSNLTKRYYLSFNNSISDLDVNSAVSNSIIAGGSIGSVTITSDGRYLGYNSISNGGWGGHIVNLETRASTSVNGENGISALSPNGNHFAYESRHGDEVTIKVAAVALP